jgi:hypothetical protein
MAIVNAMAQRANRKVFTGNLLRGGWGLPGFWGDTPAVPCRDAGPAVCGNNARRKAKADTQTSYPLLDS